MPTLSICMIIKNEEKVLDRCLQSAKQIADEIIIVDTGSNDNSINIAKKYTNQIYNFNWCDDFSKARNYSFSKSKCDYIMWLDADDIIPNKTIKYINQNKSQFNAGTYMFKYTIGTNKTNKLNYWRERIVRNCKQANWIGAVHECITPFGKIEYVNTNILHSKISNNDPKRNLKIYRKILKERELTPREQYYYSRELYDNKHYKSSIKNLKKFINGGQGWTPNIIDAHIILGQCYIRLNNYNYAIKYLIQALKHTTPTPDIACMIGDCYMFLNKHNLSKDWYLLALNSKYITNSHRFIQETYNNIYPALQLTVCYYKLGDINKAIYYNEYAGRYNKNNQTVINNRNFFNSLIKNT